MRAVKLNDGSLETGIADTMAAGPEGVVGEMAASSALRANQASKRRNKWRRSPSAAARLERRLVTRTNRGWLVRLALSE
jgi:hypothetical protein